MAPTMYLFSYFVLLLEVLLMVGRADGAPSYANVTLTSKDGDLSAVVFLPASIKPNETPYYVSSRFEHGSMIGSITRRSRQVSVDGQEHVHEHVFYGTDTWRVPHDRYWTESGIGLASEFGVGDDGDFCNYRCGWFGINDVTNGVLGYREAKSGESFLKIGVGELVKGSCATCDSTEDYKFNSPYRFAEPPKWTLSQPSSETIVLEHQALLNLNGYRLRKEISIFKDTLQVKSTLTNLGVQPFTTAWYSHHFFSCDGRLIDQSYSVDLNLRGDVARLYEEPGTWSWSKPLADYAAIHPHPDFVNVEMFRGLEPGARIKAEFVKDEASSGAFTLRSCGTAIREDIPDLNTIGGVSMYAYNLYIEPGTFSPEPQVLIHLLPGQSRSWTQRLIFSDNIVPSPSPQVRSFFKAQSFLSMSFSGDERQSYSLVSSVMYICFVFLVGAVVIAKRNSRRFQYNRIPDQEH